MSTLSSALGKTFLLTPLPAIMAEEEEVEVVVVEVVEEVVVMVEVAVAIKEQADTYCSTIETT